MSFGHRNKRNPKFIEVENTLNGLKWLHTEMLRDLVIALRKLSPEEIAESLGIPEGQVRPDLKSKER